ncbi:DUF481 domain-containing protein [Sphingosinithalassobacter portus]|uniref:DUF481 domain-containing protein n=1 Tax=Stakelama portus TaxID=2676234 RepID=UPI000D6E001A|nr:DUF481 domain-containing protein [Sphingosinithalassobacter portus]
MRILIFLAAPLLLANADDPEVIPPPIKAMLDAAMAAGDENGVAIIVKYAQTAAPDSAREVSRIATEWRTERRQTAQRRLRQSDFLDLLKGKIELGGYRTTGNTENIGLVGTIELRREGYRWRHKLRLRGEYQESLGVTTRERYLAAYEPNYKIDDRSYVYGAAQFESDRFSGFDERYSLSAGLGYTPIKRPGMTLELEVGPAFRQTHYTDDTNEGYVGGRGSLDFKWNLAPSIRFQQTASTYIQTANSTVSSNSALNFRVLGPLSAQLSYNLQYESDPTSNRNSTDTTTRAALVVDF